MMNWSILRTCLLLSCIAIACNLNDIDFKDLDIKDLQPTIVAPLGSASYTMQQLLEELDDDLLATGANDEQVVILTYSDSANYTTDEDFVSIDDVTGEGEILSEEEVTASGTEIRIPFEKEFVYVYNESRDERLDSVFYDAGEVILNVSGTCECDMDYNFVIDNTRNVTTDDPLAFSGNLRYNGTGTPSDQKRALLDNHKTLLSNNTNNFTSVFKGEIILRNGQTLRADDRFTFDFIYKDQDFDRIHGYFGMDTITIDGGDLELDLFDEAISDGLIFEGPVIEIEFQNKFGIPIGILTDSIFGQSASGDSLFLSGSVPDNPQIIAFNQTDFYEAEETKVVINPSNSNIRELFNLPPNLMQFPVTGISNVNNDNGANYLTDESDINVYFDFILPLSFRLDNYTQKIEFDIEEAYDIEEIDSLFVRLVTTNNLPFSASLSLAITDSLETELFRAPRKQVLEPPAYNAQGDLIRDSRVVTDIDLNTEGITALQTGSKLIIEITLDSPGTRVTDFYNVHISNSISIEVGLGGKGVIEL